MLLFTFDQKKNNQILQLQLQNYGSINLLYVRETATFSDHENSLPEVSIYAYADLAEKSGPPIQARLLFCFVLFYFIHICIPGLGRPQFLYTRNTCWQL